MRDLLERLWGWVDRIITAITRPYSDTINLIRTRLRATINHGVADRGLSEAQYRAGLQQAVTDYRLWLQQTIAALNRRNQRTTRAAFATLRADLGISFPRQMETQFVQNFARVNTRLTDQMRITRLINQLTAGSWDLSTPHARQNAVNAILERAERENWSLFVLDSAGRRIPIDVWVHRAVDGHAAQVALRGYQQRAQAAGVDLVKVSSHDGTCPKCAPWQNRVLSLNGTTSGYPTLAQAQAGGLFHISCRHGLTPTTQ